MMIRPRALTALTRFGLGPRPGEISEIAHDPLGYVYEQCRRPEAAMLTSFDLPDRAALREVYIELQGDLRETRRKAKAAGATEADQEANRAAIAARRDFARGVSDREVAARFTHGVRTDDPFVERLVLFWSDHFTVERDRLPVRMLLGNFERDAIRPHVLGYFEDMLAAAVTHPAMLLYLDNTRSVGPNSAVGRRRGTTSVNENLAREVLELHTLGAGGGYTQDDVIALAETLTGWLGGFERQGNGAIFNERIHEFGPRTILGKTYEVEGPAQLEAVLPDLARHPSTARNVATKFAGHFVADGAPEALVDELTDAFLVTGGDLRELAMVLVESDHAWAGEPAKTVPPYDFMVAAIRATNSEIPPRPFISRSARDLAQHIWNPPSPAGWPDDDRAFLGGDALLERIDFCRQIARRFARVDRVQDLARDLFGDALDPFVAEAVDRAEDQQQALVLLLMSPAFHRR